MEKKGMTRADFITSLVLIVVSIVVVVMSVQMPKFENRGANPWSVPGIVPGMLGIILGFLGIILLVRSVKQEGYKLNISGDKAGNWFRQPASIRLWLTILLTLGYAWGLVGRLPYLLATFLFIFAFIFIFEYDRREKRSRKVKKTILAAVIAIAVSAAVSALFQYAFLVRLP